MPKIDPQQVEERTGSRYPAPHFEPVYKRRWAPLGDAAGLTQFGVNLVTLDPGVWSSQRHWHSHEDEFIYVLRGELALIDDTGEHVMRPGDCAGYKGGERNGHHLINRSDQPAQCMVVGSRIEEDWGEYSDIDMRFNATEPTFTKKDGTPF
jgi:uncharacterized cupin superfamily protein